MFYLKINVDVLGRKYSVVFVVRTKISMELNMNV
jgi:hypothetical protein